MRSPDALPFPRCAVCARAVNDDAAAASDDDPDVHPLTVPRGIDSLSRSSFRRTSVAAVLYLPVAAVFMTIPDGVGRGGADGRTAVSAF